MKKDEKPYRLQIPFSNEELDALDEWQESRHISTRTGAIKQLIQIALAFSNHGAAGATPLAGVKPTTSRGYAPSEAVPSGMGEHRDNSAYASMPRNWAEPEPGVIHAPQTTVLHRLAEQLNTIERRLARLERNR